MPYHAKRCKRAFIVLLTAMLLIVAANISLPEASAVGPPNGIMRIGLYYGSTSLISANLQNDVGSGYDFGYINSSREFIALTSTNETKISMLRDVNLYYDADSNSYKAGTGDIQIGCYHVEFTNNRSDVDAALEAAAGIPNSFLKYKSHGFHVCSGDYTTRADAEAAIRDHGWENWAVVTSGSSQTICVAQTGTGKVIFEFDRGGVEKLAVRPRGTNTVTWFKGYKYYGMFQYSRPNGEDLTVINFVNIDDYVKGVLPYEMGKSWPLEALKAQALCARTYAATKLSTHGSSGFDLCTEDHCQVYRGVSGASDLTNQAANETAGMYITYNGALCETYYSSSDGGATESVENVWTGAKPYLVGVFDPYEGAVASQIPGYRWTVSYTPEELTTRLNARGHAIGKVVSAFVTQTTPTGNAKIVTIKDENGKTINITKGDSLRSTFGVIAIRFATGGAEPVSGTNPDGSVTASVSNSYSILGGEGETVAEGPFYAIGSDGQPILIEGDIYVTGPDGQPAKYEFGSVTPSATGSADGKIDGKFVFKGSGRGHNVGMSQWGAYAMAKVYNMSATEIIKFYFTGVSISYVDGTPSPLNN